MLNYYGFETIKEIHLFTGDVCELFDGPLILNDTINELYLNAFSMCIETIAAETLMGKIPDQDNTQGAGLSQIDMIKWKDIVEHSTEHEKTIWDKWHIDLQQVCYNSLIYNGKLAILFTRLGYKRIPAPIPSTRKGRSEYWKKHWNTYKGAGTPEEYMERCLAHIGPENTKEMMQI